MKKDPSEDGDDGAFFWGCETDLEFEPCCIGRGSGNGGVNGGIPTNGITTANGSEPQMIKANKGMILRKVGSSFWMGLLLVFGCLRCFCDYELFFQIRPFICAFSSPPEYSFSFTDCILQSVEYIRYLQQLVSVQASRGRDLEERNRALERELAAIRGTPLPSSRSASNSNSTDSSRLSLASSQTSLPQSSWESEKKWEMDVEDRGEDEERGRGRVRGRGLKEDGLGLKVREEGEERDMEI
jgi:hypothetical protein